MWTTRSAPSRARVERRAVGDVGELRSSAPPASTSAADAGSTSSADHLGALVGQPPADRGADEAPGAGDRPRPSALQLRPRRLILAPPCTGTPLARLQWPARVPPSVRAPRRPRSAASFAIPLVRKRLKIPAAVTTAAVAAGPLGARRCSGRGPGSATRPSTRCRCGPSSMAHELPYDDPEALRAPAQGRLPDPDRPGDRRRRAAQHPLAARARRPGRSVNASTGPLPGSTGSGSSSRTSRCVWILARHHERFPRAARQMSAVYDLGCASYFAVPTAPPWWASEQGHTERGRCGGSWSRSARRPGAAPGRRCTTRSAATHGRRCPPCTSRPR